MVRLRKACSGGARRAILWASLIGLAASALLGVGLMLAQTPAIRQTSVVTYSALSGPAIWEGDWELSALGADPSEAGALEGSDRVTIPFTGTALSLIVRRGDYRGYLHVRVDGQPANLLPRDRDAAYLVLTSPDYAPEVVTVPVAARLSDGPHQAVVVADRGWEQWPLVGWSVSRGPDTSRYPQAFAASVLLACATLVALGWALWVDRAGPCTSPAIESEAPHSAAQAAPDWSWLLIVGVALVFYFSRWPILTAITGLALAGLIAWRPELGLVLVAASAPFYLHPRPLAGKAFSLVEMALVLSVLAWGVRWLAWLLADLRASDTGDGRWSRTFLTRAQRALARPTLTSLDLAVGAFVLIALGSLVSVQRMHLALRELRVLILEPALFYVLLRTSRLGARSIWRIVDGFVLGAVAVAAIGLVQYALGTHLITAEGGWPRLRSVYGSPNSVGLYLGRAMPLLVAMALWGGAGMRRRRLAYAVALAPAAAALLLSFSRGALLVGLPLALLALVILAMRGSRVGGASVCGRTARAQGRWAMLAVALVAVAGAAVWLARTPRFAGLLDFSRGTAFFRLHLWRSAWAMFLDHPWLGVGPDQFLYLYRGRYILPAAWQEPNLSQAHNIILDYATRLGLGGLAVGVGLQWAFWRRAWPLCRLGEPARRALALGLMASMINFVSHGLVDASYFLVDLAFAFFLTLGVVEWLVRNTAHEDQV